MEKKDYDRAISDLTKFINLTPNFALAYNTRAQAYAAKRDYNRALIDFNKSIELDPQSANSYFNRGLLHFEIRQNDQAIEDYTRAIALFPEYVPAYSNRAKAYEAKGDTARAAADRQKVAELEKEIPELNPVIDW
jgi:tetratricopeptide (TPR) repeat protein